MSKTTIYLFVFIIICTALLYDRISAPIQIYPYPYQFNTKQAVVNNEAQESDILIIGDRMGEALTPYLNSMTTELSTGLVDDIKIYNWSQEFEGIHRSLRKIRSLKKLPKLIIYHGASTEYYEQKINAKYYLDIKKNFSLASNDIILSLIMVIPWLSKYIYTPYPHNILTDKVIRNKQKYKDIDKQKLLEVSFQMYNFELIELIQEVIDRNSIIIFITTPLNFSIAPKGICESNQTTENAEIIDKIKKLQEDRDFKQADILSQKLLTIYPTDPLAHFYKSKSSLKLGDITESKQHSSFSTVYDCQSWRGNSVYNSIMMKNIKDFDLNFVDFYKQLQDYGHSDTLFLDDLYPQNIYYKEMFTDLNIIIKKQLRLK